jgi:TonB family protein
VGGAVQADGRGQLIALGIHPVAPGGRVEVPNGNRRGSFAATPEGKAGAEGTPGIKTGTHGNPSGAGAGSSGKGTGTGDRVSGAPSGLYVGAAPSGSSQSAVGNGGGNGNGPGDSPNGDPNKPVEMASVAPPRVSIPVKKILAESQPEVEKRVFGDHQAYSMTVNVPNLNSAGGSWVIHFAELNSDEQKNQGELSAPVATHEVDPGYPLELMRHNVKGMVVLYAVIRKDGTVSDVRVLLSVDDQLDQYARAAFSKWRFQPATRDGSPVALEAVVSIPFRPFKRAF